MAASYQDLHGAVTVPLSTLMRMLATLNAIAPREIDNMAADVRANPQRYGDHAHLRAMLEQLAAVHGHGRRR